jgi:hypothetical protein
MATRGGHWWAASGVLWVVGMWACSDAGPCNVCPPLDGAYLVSWKTGEAKAQCPAKGPQPLSLNIMQVGSVARTLIGGAELAGTVYDTWDLTLNGRALDGTAYSMHGRAGPGSGADAGIRLLGTLTTNTTSIGAGTCELAEEFTAIKL